MFTHLLCYLIILNTGLNKIEQAINYTTVGEYACEPSPCAHNSEQKKSVDVYKANI